MILIRLHCVINLFYPVHTISISLLISYPQPQIYFTQSYKSSKQNKSVSTLILPSQFLLTCAKNTVGALLEI